MRETLTPEQRASRAIVAQIKGSSRIRIVVSGGDEFPFEPDAKLAHDIALSVQDYFRRKGRDRSLNQQS